MRKRHIHLQPVGGIAGDMFIAAVLNAYPELEQGLRDAISAVDVDNNVDLSITGYKDAELTGKRFDVREKSPESGHRHRHFSQIRDLINRSSLTDIVKNHAIGIFDLLAKAESQVHGIAVEKIAFHEVGALDSIADIVGAAFLLEALGEVSWSSDPLPMGRGKVESAHGMLPLPAPAVIHLLKGYPMFQDQHEGERVTPTGAAILRYLDPVFAPDQGVEVLEKCGIGFGKRKFKGMGNFLRILSFQSENNVSYVTGKIAVVEFELDDQTPEDLAVALERIREQKHVYDVIQSPVYAKKGRIAQHIQVLCTVKDIQKVADACFEQTPTLGLRWHIVNRFMLERTMYLATDNETTDVQVKVVERPAGVVTAKAEIDDVRIHGDTHAQRANIRDKVETRAIKSFGKDKDE